MFKVLKKYADRFKYYCIVDFRLEREEGCAAGFVYFLNGFKALECSLYFLFTLSSGNSSQPTPPLLPIKGAYTVKTR
jgi:hypothetical protein